MIAENRDYKETESYTVVSEFSSFVGNPVYIDHVYGTFLSGMEYFNR